MKSDSARAALRSALLALCGMSLSCAPSVPIRQMARLAETSTELQQPHAPTRELTEEERLAAEQTVATAQMTVVEAEMILIEAERKLAAARATLLEAERVLEGDRTIASEARKIAHGAASLARSVLRDAGSGSDSGGASSEPTPH